MNLHDALLVFSGFGAGVLITILVMSFDRRLVRLADEEIVVRRPDPDKVLLQAPAAIARQIFNSFGKADVPVAPGMENEARSIYAERYKRAQKIAEQAEQAERKK